MSAAEMLAILVPVLLAGWLTSQFLALVTIHWFSGAHLSPRIRQRRVMLTISFAIVLPAALGMAVWGAHVLPPDSWMSSHCGAHSHHHIHACLDTGFGAAGSTGYMIMAVIAGLLLASAMIRSIWRSRALNRRLSTLFKLSQGRGRLRYLDDDRAIAFAVGGSTPVVMLSRGLLVHLSPRQRRIVLAHESAHLRHGDPWRNSLIELLLALFMPPIAQRLRHIWRNALEHAADDAAARRFDPLDVAQTLLRVISLQKLSIRGALAMVSGESEARIRRLLAGTDKTDVKANYFEWICMAFLPAVIATAFFQHHAIETGLGWIARGIL